MKTELERVCIYLADLEAWLKRLCQEVETVKKFIAAICREHQIKMGDRDG